jgi:hypothetical protein
MTPYELRFEIFKQAYAYDTARCWNENSMNTVKMDYPDFPSYQDVESLAEKINEFVSSK